MRERLRSLIESPGRASGVVASVLAVALVTLVIEALRRWVPVLSLGSLYVFAVLPVAVIWGLSYAVAVAVASMLAFNWFFLEPVHTFTITDSKNWLALAVFVVVAVVVSELAARSRRRAREASLLAEIAGSLLERGTVGGELERISADAARALQVDSARIVLGPGGSGEPLVAGGRHVGSIELEGGGRRGAAARRRLLPALASLLAVAIDREQLEREALEAEALRRADAMKTALLRAVSHDLRTPLMAISTSAGALARRDLAIDAAGRAELLETIVDASERLDHLVSNLLDLSRLQAGAAAPEQELCGLDDLVVGALDELGAEARRVEVALPDDPPSVRVDPGQIRRVLVNLIENALKYSPPGEPVRVQVAATASEAVVRVIDHGPGVPLDERELIFEPFHRGARSGGASGAGLGLAIARGFAEANGGARRRRVARGAGRDVRPLAAGGEGAGAGLSANGTRVLVVDDEPQILRALRTSLRGAGYEVDTAETAETALAAAALRPPDAVILDLVLPDGTGIDVCRELRTWSQAPVILLSAVGEEREKVAALDAGADDYVTKPVGIDELLARLRAVLRRTGPAAEPVIEIGDLVVDLEKRAVTVGGAPVHLTPHQFELLRVLAVNRGKLLTHRALLGEVWGPGYGDASNLLHVNVSQLRRKIEPDRANPRYLLTEPGAGYRLVDPSGSAE